MTDIEVCSWPGTTVSMPMNSGRCLSAVKYSTSWYWNCWIDCHRHMLRFGLVPETSPCGITPEASHVVFGIDCPAGGAPGTNGYRGVARLASSTSWQLRLPLPPWPAWTNQSRPNVPGEVSVALLISFSIEIDPSEQVVWLWKSPATYVPGVRSATVQLTWAFSVAAQAGSPSLTVTVTLVRPGVLQVNVGVAVLPLANVPPFPAHA